MIHGQEERRDHLLLKGRSPILCKNEIKAKQHIRQTAVEQEPSTLEIKRVGNTGVKVVIEDSLVQFGQELTDSITESN